MASSEFGTGKSIVVLAIVVGCFAILWPKIFYPMMQAAFAITAPKTDGDERSFRPRDRPPHLQPGMMGTNSRDSVRSDGYVKEGRPFPHPSSRQPVKPQSKSGGAMSIIMPIYTIGIVVFFLYTVLKLVFKKNPENDKKPLIKDFHMDPQYHKFVCQQTTSRSTKKPTKQPDPVVKNKEQPKTSVFDEKNGNFDEKDYEIYKLRKKLEETESAMERIMKHMGAVSDSLSNACLLKNNPAASKEEDQTNSGSEAQSSNNKPSLKVSKKKKKLLKTAASLKKLVELHKESENTEDTTKKKGSSDCNGEHNASDDIECELKRDSSINSETSSFELLSQCLSTSSAAGDSSDDESDNDNRSSDAAENISFETGEKKSDEEINLKKNDDDDENNDPDCNGVIDTETNLENSSNN